MRLLSIFLLLVAACQAPPTARVWETSAIDDWQPIASASVVEHARYSIVLGTGERVSLPIQQHRRVFIDPRLRPTPGILVLLVRDGAADWHVETHSVALDEPDEQIEVIGYQIMSIPCDVDGDGTVTAADQELVSRWRGRKVDKVTWRADVNWSGTINSLDVAAVKVRR